jgi:folate-binding protein YgfZ
MPTAPTPSDSVPFRTLAAWADLPTRGLLRARGRDAAAFVDKFTTAAIGGLSPGGGTEAIFADVRGWVIALAAILRTDDGLMIDCDAAVAAPLREHLEHYHIREQLELVDASRDEPCTAVVGPGATAWLAAHGHGAVPSAPLEHRLLRCGGIDATVVAVDWFGAEGFLVRVPAEAHDSLHAWLSAEGLDHSSAAALEPLRIEQRYPSACDIPPKTLPQELDRTARAISFTKGCYLGQETVARIDALGHVNRLLALVAIEGADLPEPGTAVSCGREEAGTLTSVGASPRLGICGLALVHRRGLDPAAMLAVAGRDARIIRPPAAPET